MIAVGCCAFAGGFTWGLRSSGFDTIAQLEFPGVKGHLATAELNFDHPIYVGPETWPVEDLAFLEPDLVFTQPPCAPWSPAGYGPTKGINKHRDDPRVEWSKRAFRLIEELDPTIFVYESVQPTYKKMREEFFDPIALDCNLDGRTCYHLLIDGGRVGVPHHRRRYFFVTSRVEIPWEAPPDILPPTSSETLATVKANGAEPHWPRPVDARTWGGRIDDIEPGERLLAAWKRYNPPDTWTLNERGHVAGRPAFGSYRLHPDKSPNTFFGSYTLIHPTEPRPLTFEEMRAIAGYPPEFQFAGSHNASMVQMGQAVLPAVAEWMGGFFRKALERNEKAYGDTIELNYDR